MENNDSIYQRISSGIREKWESFTIKKIGAGLAVIISIFTVIGLVNTIFFNKSANLVVEGDFLYFESGNDFIRTDAGDEGLEREEIERLLPQDKNSYGISQNIFSYVQSIHPNIPVAQLDALPLFITFDIENTGNQEAQNVELSLPANGFCKVIKTGEPPVFSQIQNSQIKLGTIQPTDRVLIAIWGDRPRDDYGRKLVNLADYHGIRVQYNNDEVTYPTFPDKTSKFEAWTGRHFFFVLLTGLLIGFSVPFAYSKLFPTEDEAE